MSFAMKMNHVRLSTYHNHLNLSCVLKNICDRFEDVNSVS